MAATTTLKQNTKRGFSYYSGYPRELSAPSFCLTISARLLGGLFESFSGKTDENGNVSTCTRTYKDITEQTGLSFATISRSIKKLKDNELLDKQGQSTYVFKRDKLQDSDKKWYCPFGVATRKFKMKDDNGNVFEKTLTRGAVDVYGYIYTLGRDGGTINVTFDEIADALGIDPTTVSDAIRQLRWAKLISFPKNWVGVNRYHKSKIKLMRRWEWFKDEKKYRGRKRKSEASESTQEGGETRESYYAGLQSDARKKADKALKKAFKNKDFKKLENEIVSVRSLYREKLISNNVQAQELELKLDELNAMRGKLLINIGLSEERLTPEGYVQWEECKDTGWRSDGLACACFEKRRQRGSPPKSESGNVGELDKKN